MGVNLKYCVSYSLRSVSGCKPVAELSPWLEAILAGKKKKEKLKISGLLHTLHIKSAKMKAKLVQAKYEVVITT